MTRISRKNLQRIRQDNKAVDIYLLYIQNRVPEDKREDYTSWFIRIMKMNPEIVSKRIQSIVGNLVMKIPPPQEIEPYINAETDDWLIDLIDMAMNETKYGKPIEEWMNTFKPLVSGYLSFPYILWAVYMFRPELYDYFSTYENGKAIMWLFNGVNTVRDYLDFEDSYTISPSMFIGKEKK